MIAKVCRYYGPKEEWHVVVYWTFDPDENPHDYDLWLTPKEWRKLSGLRSPKKNETMVVTIRFCLGDLNKLPLKSEESLMPEYKYIKDRRSRFGVT